MTEQIHDQAQLERLSFFSDIVGLLNRQPRTLPKP